MADRKPGDRCAGTGTKVSQPDGQVCPICGAQVLTTPAGKWFKLAAHADWRPTTQMAAFDASDLKVGQRVTVVAGEDAGAYREAGESRHERAGDDQPGRVGGEDWPDSWFTSPQRPWEEHEMDDLKAGQRVTVVAGEDAGATGKVQDVSGAYVTLVLDDGAGLRTSSGNVRMMDGRVTTMATTTKDYKGYQLVSDDDKPGVDLVKDGQLVKKFRSAGDARAFVDGTPNRTDAAKNLSAMDLTEVSAEPDGSVTVAVDSSGDEATAGQMSAMSYVTSARCPYCSKGVSMSRGELGSHRALSGICDGSGRAVQRVELGRAVLMDGVPVKGDEVATPDGREGEVVRVITPANAFMGAVQLDVRDFVNGQVQRYDASACRKIG